MGLGSWQTHIVEGQTPTYDLALTGELSGVPCWPSDHNGDALDCPTETVLLGVVGEDGLFRAEEEPPFNPLHVTYVCPSCRLGPSLVLAPPNSRRIGYPPITAPI